MEYSHISLPERERLVRTITRSIKTPRIAPEKNKPLPPLRPELLKPNQALLYAASKGDKELIKKSIDEGANVNVTDEQIGLSSTTPSSEGQGQPISHDGDGKEGVVGVGVGVGVGGGDKSTKSKSKSAKSMRTSKPTNDNTTTNNNKDDDTRSDGTESEKRASKKLSESLYAPTGDTALHLACQYGHLDSVILLFFYGADLDVYNRLGSTPLLRAVSCNQLLIVDELLTRGAHVHVCNKIGNTILHIAAYNNSVEMCELILEKKPQCAKYIDLKNKANMTPLEYARKQQIKDLLTRHRAEWLASAGQSRVHSHYHDHCLVCNTDPCLCTSDNGSTPMMSPIQTHRQPPNTQPHLPQTSSSSHPLPRSPSLHNQNNN